MKRSSMPIILFLVSCLVLAGCGSQPSPAPSTGPASTEIEITSQPVETVAPEDNTFETPADASTTAEESTAAEESTSAEESSDNNDARADEWDYSAVIGDMPEDALAAFENAYDGYSGTGYEPVALIGTLPGEGTTYAILCKALAPAEGSDTPLEVVTIHEDPEGRTAVTGSSPFDVEELFLARLNGISGEAEDPQFGLKGGWKAYDPMFLNFTMPEEGDPGNNWPVLAYLGSTVHDGHIIMAHLCPSALCVIFREKDPGTGEILQSLMLFLVLDDLVSGIGPGHQSADADTYKNTTTPAVMLKYMQESDEFAAWRRIMVFMPAYNEDNADDLLDSIIGNMDFYNTRDFFPDHDWPDGDQPQDLVGQYLMTAFNVSESAWEHARDTWIDGMSLSPKYKEGYFRRLAAGEPKPETLIAIDSASYDGEYWWLHTRTVWAGDPDADARWGLHSHIAMKRVEWNGEQVWTMCSKTDEPQSLLTGPDDDIPCREYSWNTVEEPAQINNDLMSVSLPTGLKYTWREYYDDNGQMFQSLLTTGRHRRDEVTLTVEINDSVRSIDDAVDYYLKQNGQLDDAGSVENADPVIISGLEYRHILVDRAYTSHECFITCAEGAGGNMVYVCWNITTFKNATLNHLLTADDPQLTEIIESLVLK